MTGLPSFCVNRPPSSRRSDPTAAIIEAFETGFVQLGELVWGGLPGVADALDEIRCSSELL